MMGAFSTNRTLWKSLKNVCKDFAFLEVSKDLKYCQFYSPNFVKSDLVCMLDKIGECLQRSIGEFDKDELLVLGIGSVGQA